LERGQIIEIRDHVGWGKRVHIRSHREEVAARRPGYRPQRELEASPELKRTLDLIESGFLLAGASDDAKAVVNRLLSDGEPFLVLADFAAYALAQDQVDALYASEDEWSHKAIVNCLNMGYFSERPQYSRVRGRIWAVKPSCEGASI